MLSELTHLIKDSAYNKDSVISNELSSEIEKIYFETNKIHLYDSKPSYFGTIHEYCEKICETILEKIKQEKIRLPLSHYNNPLDKMSECVSYYRDSLTKSKKKTPLFDFEDSD